MAIVYSDDPNWMEYLSFISDMEDDDQFEDKVIYLPWTDEEIAERIYDNGIECLCKAHEAEVERRRKVRRRMKADKRIMHQREKAWERETQVSKAQGQRAIYMDVNFHRPSNAAYWRKNKHQKEELCYHDHYNALNCRVRRNMIRVNQQLRENTLVVDEYESGSVDTCEVLVEHRHNRKPHKRIVKPRLGSMHYIEELVNAREFGRAICDLRITRKMLIEQKAGNV